MHQILTANDPGPLSVTGKYLRCFYEVALSLRFQGQNKEEFFFSSFFLKKKTKTKQLTAELLDFLITSPYI